MGKTITFPGECTSVTVQVLDDPGQGNMCHEYLVRAAEKSSMALGKISFQKGPIKENGINGITNEALLLIVRDRLQGAQKGSFACRENALALTKIEEALFWLNHRTNDRRQRQVEGTSKK